jgi:hypothetical protein
MTSNISSKTVLDRPAAPPQAEADDLAALLAEVKQAERHLARAVRLAGRLAGSGVCERVEGLPLEHWIGLAGRLTGADRRMLVTAGEVLADLPTVSRLFAQGALSWGQVRAIVCAVRRLSQADRAVVDARLARTVAVHGGVDVFDPDGLVEAVDTAVDDLASERSLQRREERRREASFVAVQRSLWGGVRLYGELHDPCDAAAVVNALDAKAGLPFDPAEGDSRDGEADDADARQAPEADGGAGGDASAGGVGGGRADDAPAGGADGPRWSGRGRQYAQALVGICADWLGGDSGRPARPLLVSHVDLSQTAATMTGTVELSVLGGLPTVTARTLEALATDADLRVVLFDGARPLAVSKKRAAHHIPDDVRFAVRTRDRGCRFPGSRYPIAYTDAHHSHHRARGGDHHPDRLIALARVYHTLVHRHGWTVALNTDTGEVTVRRRGRAWRSLPRGTPLEPAPDPPSKPPDAGSVPPDPDLPF